MVLQHRFFLKSYESDNMHKVKPLLMFNELFVCYTSFVFLTFCESVPLNKLSHNDRQ